MQTVRGRSAASPTTLSAHIFGDADWCLLTGLGSVGVGGGVSNDTVTRLRSGCSPEPLDAL